MIKTLFDDYDPIYFHTLEDDYFNDFPLDKYEKKLLITELKRRLEILS